MNNNKDKVFKFSYLAALLWLILSISSPVIAQPKANIELHFIDAPPSFKINIPKHDSLAAVQSEIKQQFLEKGYLGFSIDSIVAEEEKSILFIRSGNQYKASKIEVFPEEYNEFSKIFITKRLLTQKFINSQDSRILESVQNMGYPYAILEKDIGMKNSIAEINYLVKPGSFVSFDSISTSPSNIISYNYISKKTGIEVGQPYNATAIKNLNRNVNQSQLFMLDSAYFVLTEHKAKIILKLKKGNQNSFNALLGLQTNGNNKTELTGNASIALNNAFKKGEKIDLEWQNYGNQSQQLETGFKLPYIFKLPIGAMFYGDFDKQDTSFTNTKLLFGILLPTLTYGDFSIQAKKQTSSVNKNYSEDINSSYSTLYGLGYSYSQFDNPFMPKKGFLLSSQAFAGKNNLLRNNAPDLTTPMFEWIGNVQLAFPVTLGSLFFENEWGVIVNDSLKRNNFYRLGGVKSIRGFNEKSIYAKAYNYAKFEYRLFLSSESFAYLLYDIGYFNEPVNTGLDAVWRQAFGIGFNINTATGQLSISYALGKFGAESVHINQGKIHIGYINRF